MVVEPQPEDASLEANVCWSLLRSITVGRFAVVDGDQPDIFPINYAVDRGTVVFRTAPGTKLAAIAGHGLVAFEADAYDAGANEAWSVVIKGRTEECTTIPELLDAMTLPVFPWHAGSKPRFIRIVPHQISGRRFRVLDATAWRSSITGAPHSSLE